MPAKRNSNLGSSERREKRRRLFWVRFYIILFFTLFVVFTLAILSGHDKVTIKNFVISGNGAVSSGEILKIAQADIAGRYVGLFARDNALIFPRLKISHDILNQLQTIKTVDISWQDWQTAKIAVTERKPHSVWCEATENCSFLDEDGFLYAPAPKFSGTLFIRNYGEVPARKTYKQIFMLIDLLSTKGLEVASSNFDGLNFIFTLANGPEIIFNDKEGGFTNSFQNLFTALDSGNLNLIDDVAKIDYVDLRFETKIVVGKK